MYGKFSGLVNERLSGLVQEGFCGSAREEVSGLVYGKMRDEKLWGGYDS